MLGSDTWQWNILKYNIFESSKKKKKKKYFFDLNFILGKKKCVCIIVVDP
jgi:hypothetical protein